MEIKFTKCEIDGDKIEFVGRFIMRLGAIEKAVNKGGYESDSLYDYFFKRISEKVADAYLSEKKMELVNSVDLKKITDAIQLKVVEGFSLNGH